MAKAKDKRSPPPPVPAMQQTMAANKPKKTATTGNGNGSPSTSGRSSDSRKRVQRRAIARTAAGGLLGVVKIVVVVALLSALLAYSPGLLDIDPVRLEVQTSPRPFTGSLAPNSRLDEADKLFRHFIVGPESIAFHDGDLYTGLLNGWIVRIKDDRTIEPILTVGDPECEPWEERRCGRPLGLRFDGNGTLYFVDSYFGLYKADVRTGVATALYRSSDEVNGKQSKIVNDLTVGSTGEDFYFTDSSTRFHLDEGIYEALESAPSGRVLHYNVKTNTTTLIVDGLAFANGIQLSAEEDYLLIAETNRHRILKHHLRGKQKGETEVFLDNLPGVPDNVRSNGEGGYWIPIVVVLHSAEVHRALFLRLGPYPMVRKIIARFIAVVRFVLQLVDAYVVPSAWTKTAVYKLAHMMPYTSFIPAYGLVLEVDGEGDIVGSLHSPDGSLAHVSEVARHGRHLYFGSPWNGFLARLKM